jgi:hypothetical protein
MAKERWRVSFVEKVDADFSQIKGPRKLGTDCTVAVRDGSSTQRVIVRIFADNISRGPRQADAVIAYVQSLLDSGWTPEQYNREPGELVVPVRFQVPPRIERKPWWRFW